MPIAQPGAVLNLMLLFLCGGGGWFLAAWLKTSPVRKTENVSLTAGAPGNEPGTFAADALHMLTAAKAGAGEFDEYVARYGSGTASLQLLAAAVMEKWIAGDAAGALSAGIPRCAEHAAGALPTAMALLAARAEVPVAGLLAALPAGPLREPCVSALAGGWGRAKREEALTQAPTLSRGERTLFLREWHRARGETDLSAAQASATAQKDPDDREAGLQGCLLARALTEPQAVLQETLSREDIPEITLAAFRSWLSRDPAAAWNFAATCREHPALPGLAVAILKAGVGQRQLSTSLPELTTLLSRLFPVKNPPELSVALVPALVAEREESAQKFIELQPGNPDVRRHAGGVALFDSLCLSDPPAAWRFAESCVQLEGAKDLRTVNHWTSAAVRENATPQQRLDAGFPDFSDMSHLALHWLQSDPAAALTTFCGQGVDPALKRLAVETAISPDGAAIPADDLVEWAKHQPGQLLEAVKAGAGK